MNDATGPRFGIVTDPDSPTHVASHLTAGLPEWLLDRTGDEWQVEVVTDSNAVESSGIDDLMDRLEQLRRERGWRLLVGTTDLPLLLDDRPAVAQWDRDRGTAVVSLPALGLRLKSQLQRVFRILIRELVGASDVEEQPWPVERDKHDDEETSARFTVRPLIGWPLLVLGMVRTNQPWHLTFGLSSALAGALAASAFGLSSATIWRLADMLPSHRRVIAAGLAVAVLVAWLILSHGLWERRSARPEAFRRLATLYNIATVSTLVVGIMISYAALLVFNAGLVWFLVPEALVAAELGHQPHAATYWAIAWGFTTLGMLAGAIGSSLDSDEVVRQAAYGARERYRLHGLRD